MVEYEFRNIDKKKKYLFICAFGESRSKFYSDKFTLNGFNSKYCGFDKLAVNKFNSSLLKWSDVIIVLDEYFIKYRAKYYLFNTIKHKTKIEFFIDDEPKNFEYFLPMLCKKIKSYEIIRDEHLYRKVRPYFTKDEMEW